MSRQGPGNHMKNRQSAWDHTLQLFNIETPRVMLADAVASKGMRVATDFEVEHVMRNADFSGVAMLGPRKVSLRSIKDISALASAATI